MTRSQIDAPLFSPAVTAMAPAVGDLRSTRSDDPLVVCDESHGRPTPGGVRRRQGGGLPAVLNAYEVGRQTGLQVDGLDQAVAPAEDREAVSLYDGGRDGGRPAEIGDRADVAPGAVGGDGCRGVRHGDADGCGRSPG